MSTINLKVKEAIKKINEKYSEMFNYVNETYEKNKEIHNLIDQISDTNVCDKKLIDSNRDMLREMDRYNHLYFVLDSINKLKHTLINYLADACPEEIEKKI